MPSTARATVELNAQARLLSPGLIEILCTGHIQAEDSQYLVGLARLLEAEQRVCIVFDAMALESYSAKFPLAHVEVFRRFHSRLGRIAVAHHLKSIAFAIATVSLASHTNIKGFPSRDEALAWLRES